MFIVLKWDLVFEDNVIENVKMMETLYLYVPKRMHVKKKKEKKEEII